MSDKKQRETWLSQKGRAMLRTGEKNQLVVPGPKYKIFFYRGHSFTGQDTEKELPGETKVISPIDKKTLGLLFKHKLFPEAANQLLIRVETAEVKKPELKVKASAGSVTLNIKKSEDGNWITEHKVVLMYGKSSDLKGAKFEGIDLVDVGKSGDIGYAETVEFTCGTDKRKLGLIDFLIENAEGKYTTSRYGIFKTRTPNFKLPCYQVGPNRLDIILDDGDDESIDKLNLTVLIDPASSMVDKKNFRLAVPHDSRRIDGNWDQQSKRSRLYYEPPKDGDLALFMFGENRVRVYADGELLFVAHFFLYLDDGETIAGLTKEEIFVNYNKIILPAAKDQILLDFKDSASGYDIGCYLYSLYLRPQGYTGEFKILQAAPHEKLNADELVSLVEKIKSFKDDILEDINFNVLAKPADDITLERYADAFIKTTAPVEFDAAANGWFNNAFPDYFHHFFMNTFPAHRLIDKILYKDVDPPVLNLSGAHFETNKTFILPTAKDELHELKKLIDNHSDRKLAVFGHTDKVGTQAYNDQLSLLRGQSAYNLLIKNAAWWDGKFYTNNLQNELPWGTREVQYMLSALGYYNYKVDGIMGQHTRNASTSFRNDQGLGPGNDFDNNNRLNPVTRQALISAYMDNLFNGQLNNNNFFQDPAPAPAVFGCGEAYPLIQSNQANAQNRRVVFVLRKNAVNPIDLAQMGQAVPFNRWLSQEASDGNKYMPPFLVGCYDTGIGMGAGDNYSGDKLDADNRISIRGRRLKKPSHVDAAGAQSVVMYADGDLSQLSDSATPHGTGVMTCMASDGAGNELGGNARDANQTVLGTGKDIFLRPIKKAGDFKSSLRNYELLAADSDIKVVSSSFLFTNMYGLTQAERKSLEIRIRNLLNSGKIYFIAAANVNPVNFPKQRDVARTEGGYFAPTRSQPRSSLSGDQSFRQRIATVGATTCVVTDDDPEMPTNFTYLGAELSLAAPGNEIRVFYATGGTVVDGIHIRNIDGTSFATPMTAGVAAEMMLVNPELQKSDKMVQVIEMLEASAEELPSLASAPPAEQGLFLPGQPNADPNLVPADLAGFRRINFWKAVLCALNEGIPSEAVYKGNPATGHFTSLTAKTSANTKWYGFEIRIPLFEASVWLQKSDGSWVRLEDPGATLPDNRKIGLAWRAVQPLRVPATNANAGYRGFVLPAVQPTAISLWLCQFSIKHDELTKYSKLAVFEKEVDPGYQSNPPASQIDLTLIDNMRSPKNISAAQRTANISLDQIASHVEEFSYFVFHLNVAPAPFKEFKFVNSAAANAGEEIDVFIYAIDTLNNIKLDYNNNIDITHNGFAGAVLPAFKGGGTSNKGVFINGNPAAAPVNVAMAGGKVGIKLSNFNNQKFHLNVDDNNGHNGQSGDIQIARPGAVNSLKIELAFFNNADDPLQRNPWVAEQLKVTLKVLDTAGRVKTDYTGKVKLTVIEGETGWDEPGGNSPYKGGVHVANSVLAPFNANLFEHQFAAGDKGTFDFPVFVYTSGNTKFGAQIVDTSIKTESQRINIVANGVDNLKLDYPQNTTTGNTFNLAVSVRDKYNNVIIDYSDKVTLSLIAGTAGAAAGNVKSGVFFTSTSGEGTYEHTFRGQDKGVWNFPVTAYTAEVIQIRASAPPVNSDTNNITVNGPGALSKFRFEINKNQTKGVRYRVIVSALDANDQVINNANNQATLCLVKGTPGDGSGSKGTDIHNTPHVYTASDRGSFAFEATSYTPEEIKLRAFSGAVSTDSDIVNIGGYRPLNDFQWVVQTNTTTGNTCSATIRAVDINKQIITDFNKKVKISLAAGMGTPYSSILGRRKRGVKIGGASHTFDSDDEGQYTFSVTAYTAETIMLQVTCGGMTKFSPAITVT